ncbi:VOC family protein [Streptomyces albidoflavus]
MTAELQCVVLDCPAPLELAGFYRSLLGGAVNQEDRRWAVGEDWATLHTPSGLVLAFRRVTASSRPGGPPSRPQQFHLDIGVPDLEQSQGQALASGATVLDDGSGERGWSVLADPAGHPFCLVRH